MIFDLYHFVMNLSNITPAFPIFHFNRYPSAKDDDCTTHYNDYSSSNDTPC